MDYIYGTVRRSGKTYENLKTVGTKHSNLSGAVETVRDYDDAIITDRCTIIAHYHNAEDVSGLCYDWYTITDHYRCVDKSPEVQRAQEAAIIEALAILEGMEDDENDVPV